MPNPNRPWWVPAPPPQQRIEPMAQPTNRPGPKTLAGVIGVVAAGILYVTIPQDEGTKYKAYRDLIGVLTICTGDTANVTPGQVATKAECEARLERQLIAHAEPVMRCTPRLAEDGRDYQRAAAVSLAYNIGVNAYCRSSIDRNFDAGNWRAGCDAFLRYRFAGGREVRGLALRRQREREICLRGLS